MSKIKVLDKKTINKIAAGEIVERPSSVVKELIENSIDANATSITIEIINGGLNFIKITDNGDGIEKDDIEKAFLNHSTSKLNSIEDLYNIFSLGFRGEALASISAVSQIEIITKTKTEENGTRANIEYNEVLSLEDCACMNGTSITVNNLFYNIPARRKFLKKPSVECSYISDIINKIALSHPEISFKFLNNNSIILHTSGNNDLKSVIFNIYGKDIFEKMIYLNVKNENYNIYGFIGNTKLSRANRNSEILFVNKRYIKSLLVSNAIENAYKTKFLTGKFPFYILNLELSPSKLDINVHPTKLEIKFDNENIIYEFIYNTIENTLKENILMQEETIISDNDYIKFEEKNISNNIISNDEFFHKKNINDEELFFRNNINNNSNKKCSKIDNLLNSNNNKLNINEEIKKYSSKSKNNKTINNKKELNKELFFNNYKIIGQIFDRYWIIEQNNSIFYIDQKEAQRKVIFEDIINNLKNGKLDSQKLISPGIFNICKVELNSIKENINILFSFGFEIEILDKNSISIKTIPSILKDLQNDQNQYFNDILSAITKINFSNNLFLKNSYDNKIISIAKTICELSIKLKNKLTFEEIYSFIYKLLNIEEPFYSPEGNKIIMEINKSEIDKFFKK